MILAALEFHFFVLARQDKALNFIFSCCAAAKTISLVSLMLSKVFYYYNSRAINEFFNSNKPEKAYLIHRKFAKLSST